MLNLGELQVKIGVDSNEAKSGLQDFGNEVSRTESKVGGKFKALGSKMGKFLKGAAIAGAAAVTAATVKITKDALKAYAEFEQLEGGVKKLFGDDVAKTVGDNAQKAFRTAGMSANQYMETVTTFSSSLIKSLNGDTEKAAKTADIAIQDMADNANTFGTDIQSIQNAYQGFAKQNYTMLDNLKLGFAGTKEGMQELLDKAQEITGTHYELGNMDDMINAIHVVQDEMNITGTTADEAMKTIEGSVNATKAAWENLLVGLADEDADLDTLFDNLLTSATAAAKNIIPRIGQILGSLVSVVGGKLKEAFSNLDFGDIGSKFSELVDSIKNYISNIDWSAVGDTLVNMISNLGTFITNGLLKLANSIGEGDGSFVEGLVTVVGRAFQAVMAALPGIFAGLLSLTATLVGNVCVGILKALGNGLAPIGKAFSDAWKSVKDGASKAFDGIKNAINNKLKSIVESVKSDWEEFKNGFKEAISPVINIHPIQKLQSLVAVVKAKWNEFKSALKNKANALVNFSPLQKLKSLIDKVKKVWTNFKNALKQKATPSFNFGPFSTLSSWISRAKGWWDSLRSKLSQTITGHISTSGGGSVNGNYVPKRTGLHTVPYDDYKASLHKGEAVLTAAEANVWKRFIERGFPEEKPQQIVEAAPSTSYNFGNITVDVSSLKDLTTVEDFVDMMIRAKQFA